MDPITATVQLDYPTCRQFLRFVLLGRSRRTLCLVLFALPFIALLGLVAYSFITFPGELFLGNNLRVAGLAVLYALAMCALYFWLPKYMYKKMARMFTRPMRYAFFETRMESCIQSDNPKPPSVRDYASLSRIYETADAFYLFVSANQGILLPKESLAPEDAPRLGEVLRRAMEDLGKKYIVC